MRRLVLLIAGFVIWSAAFLAVYAVQATGCAIGMEAGLLRGLLILCVAVGLVAGAIPLWLARRGGVLGQSAAIAAAAAMASTLLTLSGVFWLGPC
ncbi:hypothetical protein [Falsirhodobacter xinxiangensis]|uniref:hypothetical protein n=1 Tax=Falsirhodobacter xinxiangensis TaxID=2530049 RepID=UPI0010AB38F5|nr:hypothetical protein [Rhodobacter xinxiangensis]